MNLRELKKEIFGIRQYFDWKRHDSGSIRGYQKSGKKLIKFCPLTALYKIKTGDYLDTYNTLIVAQKLGIKENIRKVVMRAADNGHTIYSFKMTKQYTNLRKFLVETLIGENNGKH